MRKEIIIAVVVGIVFGLIVTYGVYSANEALRSHNGTTRQANAAVIPSPTPITQTPVTFSLTSPEDGIVVDKPEVVIQGTTSPQAIVAIVTEDTELLVEPDVNGLFSQRVSLIRGANTIQVTASDTNQISGTKIIHVVYTTELGPENT